MRTQTTLTFCERLRSRSEQVSRVSTLGLLISLVFLSTACAFHTPPAPSVIVILIENLGFNTFSCSDNPDSETDLGFRTFCDESVRFTHAYTPSTLSQATVASILTGRYPFEHGVRDNGAQSLPMKIETVAELAVKNHYRSGFFSGGPPVWRKSGLGQGFETFDDNVLPTLSRVYRPASEVVQLFLKWQWAEALHSPFFSFLFFGDLQFIDSPTTNEIGELRESSFESQLDVVRESLGHLVRELKRRQIWDSSYVILAGLNGVPSDPHPTETRSLKLSSEATRIALMIKPARRGRDGPFNWKIDSNVSLTDLGATLFDILGHPFAAQASLAQVVSLKNVLYSPQPDWSENRKVISETAWAAWRNLGSIRFAIRQGSNLLLQDKQDLLFDTLSDSLEAVPIPPYDTASLAVRRSLSSFLYTIKPTPWIPPSRLVVQKYELARELWRVRAPSSDTLTRLKALSDAYPDDLELRGWRAIWALRMANWKELKVLAEKPHDQPIWSYVASRNLGEKVPLPTEPCLSFLTIKKNTDWKLDKACASEPLANLLAWASETAEPNVKTRAMEIFIKHYGTRALSDRISEQNYVTGLMWDTNLARLQSPDIVDLILALPEMRKYRNVVLRRLSNADAVPN